MEQPLISMIVPVYGVEKYLAKCVESLIHQTWQNWELLLMDDCSPDRCGEICDAYARQDSRVLAIHQSENRGAAEARNQGLELARGQYIFFADSDDWIEEDTLQALYTGMQEHGADCCVGGCVTVYEREDGTLDEQKRTHEGDRCIRAEEAMKQVLLQGSAAWNRLFRREAFDQLRFPIGRINDDEYTVLRLYASMDKILFLDKDTYYYRKRADSITTAKVSLRMLDYVVNSRENLEFVTKENPQLIEAAEYKYIKAMLWCYVNFKKQRTPELRDACAALKPDIRKMRKTAWKNPYLGLTLKLLATVCAV